MADGEVYRVLCLDGGGMRGVYTATYLNGLARAFARRRGVAALDIGSGFDLICGTSTGAIVASALACGIDVGEVVRLYESNGAAIFPSRVPKSFGARLLIDLVRRPAHLRAGTRALRAALRQRLGEATFGEVFERRGIALAFPAVALASHRSWVFKTPHLASSNHRDDAVTLVDACLASSAAPVFRSIAMLEGTVTGADTPQAFVDGGLWANNPILVGLVEALEATRPDQRIDVFCLGTVPAPTGQNVAQAELHRGLPGWGFGSLAAGVSIDAQQFAYDNMARMLAKHVRRDCRIHRFPAQGTPASLLPFLDLDDTRPDAIAALETHAGSDVNMTNSACGDAGNPAGQAICELFMSGRMCPAGVLPVLGAGPGLS